MQAAAPDLEVTLAFCSVVNMQIFDCQQQISSLWSMSHTTAWVNLKDAKSYAYMPAFVARHISFAWEEYTCD